MPMPPIRRTRTPRRRASASDAGNTTRRRNEDASRSANARTTIFMRRPPIPEDKLPAPPRIANVRDLLRRTVDPFYDAFAASVVTLAAASRLVTADPRHQCIGADRQHE